jgi:tRNA pseudouridine32 synthase/23S rRNA pseudouridine746 synthase
MRRFILKATIGPGQSERASEFLASQTGLSKGRVKDAMNKGAVWTGKGTSRTRRLRRAMALLKAGDHIEFYYDEKLLSQRPPEARCLSDQTHYSVWYKPSGLVSQGTLYGDHSSLMRQAELFYRPSRDVFLVHRLDREVSGVMLLAHSRDAAAKLSELFRQNRIVKRYRVEVLGNLGQRGRTGTIDLLLDGKPSVTEFRVEAYNSEKNTSAVDVIIRTGRLHQIRRHFDMIGFPVMGDPKYGRGNKNTEGMKLSAVSLRFRCPILKDEVEFSLSE